MKTTSYEISKKLAEIGFKTATSVCKTEKKYSIETREDPCYLSYDLETILEALPNFIENGNGTGNCLVVDVAFGEIHYEGDCENDALFITTTRKNESLADTAARLLILLHEKGLINFNEEKQCEK